MPIQIQYRRGTAAEWTSANPLLAAGEPGYETDTGKFKVGDGSTYWTSLGYSSGQTGPAGTTPIFTRQGTVTTGLSGSRYYVERSGTVNVVRASVGTAPTGSALTVDVLKNGTSILSSAISIAAGTNTATGTISTSSVSSGDYFTINVTGVGSTIAGANLTVSVNIL